MRRLPPLAAVRVFEAAARHLNFTAAAAELGMTQAAVSYQVRIFEERLGAPLFIRERGRVHLTPAAARASPLVSAAFDMLGDAVDGIRADDDKVLRISAAATFAANWLAPRIGDFQLRHSALAVQLDASDAVVDFDRAEVDVGIRATVAVAPPLHGDRLFGICFLPMASPDFLARHRPADPAALLGLPRLTPDDPWWTIWFTAVGIDYAGQGGAPALSLDSQMIEANAAMAGAGIALLNPEMWGRERAEGRLVAPFAQVASHGGSFWLVTPKTRRQTPKIKAFRDWLLAAAAT